MNCQVCGKEIKEQYTTGTCSEKCFQKQFWNEVLDNNAIIIDGNCYPVDNEDSTSYFRGFGGRPFTIKMHDGKSIHTTNLWHQGTIPKEFYKGDNAEFI